MKSTLIISLAFMVSAANVGLNLLIARAASAATDWVSMFGTKTFVLAFLLGGVSLTLMASFYYVGRNNQIGMANGVLLMGATSIIVGTLVGVFGQSARVHWSEWCIFVLLVACILVRLAKLAGRVQA